MTTTAYPVPIRSGWLAVPVIDDETGERICWDIHRDEPDWATNEELASVATLAEARRVIREQLADERCLAGLLRLGGF